VGIVSAAENSTSEQYIDTELPFMMARNTDEQYINTTLPFMMERSTDEQYIDTEIHFYSEQQTTEQYIDIFLDFATLNDTSEQYINISLFLCNATNAINFTYSIDNETVVFTDTSLFGDYWIWDFGDGTEISGRYSEHKNPIHTYNIDWDNVNSTIDEINYTVVHEVYESGFTNFNRISKEITLERPETVEETETTISIPTPLIISFFAVLVVLTLLYVFFDQVKGIFNKVKK